MKLIPFLIGLITGYWIIQFIVEKLVDKDEPVEIDSCEDCPIYIERDNGNSRYHYHD